MRSNPPRGGRAPYGERSDGFTLVEVIVVLVILAILAAIAIPALTGYINKASTSQIKAKARTAAVAMQTILSEAYADPQTRLPVDTEGALYVDGKMIAQPDKYNEAAPDAVIGAPEDMYDFNGTNKENLVDLFRKLDPSAIALTGEAAAPEAVCMTKILFDKHFSLITYAYIDPETYLADDMRGMRLCTYNMNISENGTFSYDHSVGFKVWEVDADDKFVPIG